MRPYPWNKLPRKYNDFGLCMYLTETCCAFKKGDSDAVYDNMPRREYHFFEERWKEMRLRDCSCSGTRDNCVTIFPVWGEPERDSVKNRIGMLVHEAPNNDSKDSGDD